ncbi:Aste57867_1057 [Aphanomyces stellatus]|uniref:Aste57867_1057 protein n=1 Tax=Aphanomyces stellatus TaxID=120398 RepID=A0A485K5A6_9STRA|nr:hypothetical protein As57867_001056 [Aphanomyces stellatus]VFT78279.1 Aste57867_1057 [Aphanomyces stellatus]
MWECTPLICAAYFGYDAVIKVLQNHPKTHVNCTNSDGTTALNIACQNGHESSAKLLLGLCGVDATLADKDGDAPLLMASYSGLDAVVESLLERVGICQIDIPNKSGRRPLSFAAAGNHVNLIRLYLQNGVNINATDEMGDTALHWASKMKSTDAVQELLQHVNVNVNIQNKDGWTPLLLASAAGHNAIVTALLTCPSLNVNLSCGHHHDGGKTAIFLACELGHESIALQLLEHRSLDFNSSNADQYRPFEMACAAGLTNVVVKMLSRPDFIDVNEEAVRFISNFWMGFVDANTCGAQSMGLHFACKAGFDDVVRVLLACPTIDVNQPPQYIQPHLYTACENGCTSVVQLLLDYPGIDVNGTGGDDLDVALRRNHATPLMAAAKNGHDDVVAMLLHWHANDGAFIQVNVEDKVGKIHKSEYHDLNECVQHGNSAMMLAAMAGHANVVALFLACDRCHDVHLSNENGHTVLHLACVWNHGDVVNLLFERATIDINTRAANGDSALMLAAAHGFDQICRLLLTHHEININASNYHGDTALSRACDNNHSNVVVLFLAQPSIAVTWTDTDDNTLLMRAANHGRHEILNVLLSARASQEVDEEVLRAIELAIAGGHFLAFQALIQSIESDELARLFRLRESEDILDLAMEHHQYNIVHELLSIVETFQHDLGTKSYVWLRRRSPVQHKNGTLYLKCTAAHLTHESAMRFLVRDLPFEMVNGRILARNHCFSWTTLLDLACDISSDVRRSCIQAIVDHPNFAAVAKEWLHALAFARDQNERRAIDTTDATTRKYLHDRLFFCGRYELFDGPPVHVSPTSVVAMAYDHEICHQIFLEHAIMGNLDKAGFIKCSQLLGRLLERNASHKKRERDSDMWAKDFHLWDKDENGSMSAVEFADYCAKHFCSKLKVALKFMRRNVEYDREVKTRGFLTKSSHVLGLLPAEKQDVFKEHVKTLTINDDLHMSGYPNVLAMPAADRSLEDIYAKELPKDTKIKDYLFEVAEAISQLHDMGIIHGDIKSTNILRVANRLKLIDLDAAARMGKEPLGSKFSSGVLPPEMFYKLQHDADVAVYQAYWDDEAHDTKCWNKLKPKDGYVVRAHHPDHAAALPYSLVQATPAVDMWAFGCLMYRMLCGEELVHTDINHDVVSNQMKIAASWTDESLAGRIGANIPDTWAQTLLKKLLVVDPTQRLSAADVVKAFNDGADFAPLMTKLEKVHVASQETLQHVMTLTTVVEESGHLQAGNHLLVMDNVSQLQRVVFDGIVEVHDVVTPTSFVVLPFKFGPSQSNSSLEILKTFVSQSLPVCLQLKDVFDQVASMDSLHDIPSAMHAYVGAILQGLKLESAYLYLIDEGTGKIIVPHEADAVYPIEIQSNDTAFWVAGLPWIESGLAWLEKGLASADVAIDWLQLFGFVPDLKKQDDGKGEAIVDDALPTVLVNGKEVPVTRARGRVLRQLKKWLEAKDPGLWFGGLQRVMTKDGRVVWTTLNVVDEETSKKVLLKSACSSVAAA